MFKVEISFTFTLFSSFMIVYATCKWEDEIYFYNLDIKDKKGRLQFFLFIFVYKFNYNPS